jgi:hypothetical protein
MTSPAVVILTEPTHCELADAGTLVQALLQVQQLNQAGVSVSQAFCDHPAEAMRFVEAYAKAYPELQAQSSELPVPEHLYSMIADGRLNPLQAPAFRPDAKLDDAGRLQPLYVLSLGAPDILMQALQDNRLANNGIHVVEIAPVEDVDGERLSVAEAVGTRTAEGPSWLPESSVEFRAEEQGLLPLEDPDSAPLKLDSVEPDLDHIEIDQEMDHTPAPPISVDAARVSRATVDTGADRPVQTKAPAATSEPAAAETAAAPAAAAAVQPSDAARIETGATETSTASISALDRDAAKPLEPLSDRLAEATDLIAGDGSTKETEPPAEDVAPADELDPAAGDVSDPPDMSPAPPAAAAEGTELGMAASGEPDGEMQTAVGTGTDGGGSHSFSDPDEDVFYPPSGSFVSDEDDLPYPLPMPGPGVLEGYLGLALAEDVLDLEAFGRSLSFDDQRPDDDPLDPVLMRPPGLGEREAAGPIAPPDPPASDPSHGAEHDQSDAHNPIMTALHDLDI